MVEPMRYLGIVGALAVGYAIGVGLIVAGVLVDGRGLVAAGIAVVALFAGASFLLLLRYARHAAGAADGLSDRLASSLRSTEGRLVKRIDGVDQRLSRSDSGMKDRLWMLRSDVIRDTAAQLALHQLLPVPAERMPLTDFSALPATVLNLVQHVRELPAFSTIVEIGSGQTTVWMALEARRRDAGLRIVTIESDAGYAATTRRILERNGVADLVELRVVELTPMATAFGEQLWYDRSAWEDLEEVALLFVDGPVFKVGPKPRYPVFEAFRGRIAPGGLVIHDDIYRDGMAETLEAWQALDIGGRSPEIVEERERTAVLRFPR